MFLVHNDGVLQLYLILENTWFYEFFKSSLPIISPNDIESQIYTHILIAGLVFPIFLLYKVFAGLKCWINNFRKHLLSHYFNVTLTFYTSLLY